MPSVSMRTIDFRCAQYRRQPFGAVLKQNVRDLVDPKRGWGRTDYLSFSLTEAVGKTRECPAYPRVLNVSAFHFFWKSARVDVRVI